MFRPYMAIIRFFSLSLKVSLYKLREKGCDLEISHQIIILVCLCVGGDYITHIYRVFQNLCHKLFLGFPHPKISKKVPINMGPKMNRFRDIDLRSCAGTFLSIT